MEPCWPPCTERHWCVRARRAESQVTELLRPAVSALACENTSSEQSLDRLSSCHWLPVAAARSGCRGAASLMKGQRVNGAPLEKRWQFSEETPGFCDGLFFLRILHKHRKLARGGFFPESNWPGLVSEIYFQ